MLCGFCGIQQRYFALLNVYFAIPVCFALAIYSQSSERQFVVCDADFSMEETVAGCPVSEAFEGLFESATKHADSRERFGLTCFDCVALILRVVCAVSVSNCQHC